MAYIVSSLKNPEEVAELRKIYGAGFFLFAVHTDPEVRAEYLSKRGMTRSEAWDLISHDEHEEDEYGQHTRATFHLADFFLADERNEDKLRHSISRCLDLVFGCPYITPTFNEFAMFMAFAASLRSADLSRQVGAVISRNHEIVAMGANDCPAAGGGLYWPQFIGDRIDDAPRGRDYKRGFDSNLVERCKLISDIVDGLPTDIRPHVKDALSKSRIRDVTEYGRVVHAEMEALLSCARTSASTAGATLYCTTFPCHNCAKHIIAAGIDQVVYVEPYPKSKAVEFHDEAVTTGKVEGGEKRVRFKPFIGVGPRKFFELFSMNLSSGRPNVRKNDKDGTVVIWQESEASPRIPMLPVCHRDFENQALAYLRRLSRDRRTP